MQINRLTPIPMKMDKMNKMAMARSSGQHLNRTHLGTMIMTGFDYCESQNDITRALMPIVQMHNDDSIIQGRISTGKAISTKGLRFSFTPAGHSNGYDGGGSYDENLLSCGIAIMHNSDEPIVVFASCMSGDTDPSSKTWSSEDLTYSEILLEKNFDAVIIKDGWFYQISAIKGVLTKSRLQPAYKNIWAYVEWRWTKPPRYSGADTIYVFINGVQSCFLSKTGRVTSNYLRNYIAVSNASVKIDDLYVYEVVSRNSDYLLPAYGSVSIAIAPVEAVEKSTLTVKGASDATTALTDNDDNTYLSGKPGDELIIKMANTTMTPVFANLIVKGSSEGGAGSLLVGLKKTSEEELKASKTIDVGQTTTGYFVRDVKAPSGEGFEYPYFLSARVN